ncbi:MAG: hypothetical protein COX57_11925 [Alphaproteobacteria bacterium CG_4_10_14_0_2_um_filter_63_37]|nr:MAG: hypothetical protein AUJ55_04870 [Proteobacteria bacterium CG1_02_64_396]PJA23816.1 MAG: hypothetical protein COX57_11925 [Alphaproteobacteria bacterium CG_4_10_14_0_2_um_filter_63_37]
MQSKIGAPFGRRIIDAIAHERLRGYVDKGAPDHAEGLLAHYFWNVRLGESLYPLFHTFEVTLRNTLHEALSDLTGREDWMTMPGTVLDARELHSVVKACEQLRKGGKEETADRIVAELTFGFWTRLFDRRYEHGQISWPRLLKQRRFFQAMPPGGVVAPSERHPHPAQPDFPPRADLALARLGGAAPDHARNLKLDESGHGRRRNPGRPLP